jgi:hypothetical protein
VICFKQRLSAERERKVAERTGWARPLANKRQNLLAARACRETVVY